MRYTYIILGHLARRQLRYCEGHVCLKMALSGLKSEQEPYREGFLLGAVHSSIQSILEKIEQNGNIIQRFRESI